MTRFVIANAGLVALLALALAFGGVWPVLALLYMTVLTFVIDRIGALAAADAPERAEFPASTALLVGLGIAHFVLLVVGIQLIGTDSHLETLDKVLCFTALGLYFGQISHPVAHELIHRSARVLRHLGIWVYTTLLFGHHASAHVRVHHVHVATSRDPASCPKGRGFWRYAVRAWKGSFTAGLAAEKRLRGGPGPYRTYVAGAALSVVLALVIAGPGGLLVLLGLASYAQIQILLSDYVQHYGLRRADGTPVSPAHSWNAPGAMSGVLMLNAPRHSDHHAHPSRDYPALRVSDDMPVLPHPLPVMSVIALWPGLWRRVMDPRLREMSQR